MWIVINDPQTHDGQALIVNVSTLRPGAETTCMVRAGEHKFIRHDIRPGQRHPYRKGTQTQIDERRGYVMRLMDRGVPKMLIHTVIKTKFHRQWRTVDRDIDLIGGAG